MPVDRTRESWKPGMSWEKAVEDIEYIRGLGREMGGPERSKDNISGADTQFANALRRWLTPGVS